MVENSEIGLVDAGGKEGKTGVGMQSQPIPTEEPTPIQFNSSECDNEVKWKRVQHQGCKNIIKLSEEFGTIFDGLENDAEVLFEKLDQRRRVSKTSSCNNQLVPKGQTRSEI